MGKNRIEERENRGGGGGTWKEVRTWGELERLRVCHVRKRRRRKSEVETHWHWFGKSRVSRKVEGQGHVGCLHSSNKTLFLGFS